MPRCPMRRGGLVRAVSRSEGWGGPAAIRRRVQHAAHLARQFHLAERLVDQLDARFQAALALDHVGGVARHVENLETGRARTAARPTSTPFMPLGSTTSLNSRSIRSALCRTFSAAGPPVRRRPRWCGSRGAAATAPPAGAPWRHPRPPARPRRQWRWARFRSRR